MDGRRTGAVRGGRERHGVRGGARRLGFAWLFVLLAAFGAAAQKQSADARLEQAATLIRQNRLVEAEQQLNAVLKFAPNEARALNLLGTIRGSQRRFDEAEALFTKAAAA